MLISNPIIKHKAGLLDLIKALCNASKAFKVMGVSRDTYYWYHDLLEECGGLFADKPIKAYIYSQE